MGASSVTGVGQGMSGKEVDAEYPAHLHSGCGGKGPAPNPCGPFSCAFSEDFDLQCGCGEPVKRGCVTVIKVGGKSKIRVGGQNRIKVC